MGCCDGSSQKSANFTWIGNNSMFAGEKYVSPASFYEIHHNGESIVLHESDFGTPFEVGGGSFLLTGVFVSSQIWTTQEGAFDVQIEIVTKLSGNKLYRAVFTREVKAFKAIEESAPDDVPEYAPEVAERGIADIVEDVATPTKRKSKRKKAIIPEDEPKPIKYDAGGESLGVEVEMKDSE